MPELGGFRRSRSGVVLRLDPTEAELLDRLLGQLVDLVQPADAADTDPLSSLVGIGTATEPPSDPALARLFPDAYPDDPKAAGEFRRYTEDDLRATKLDNAMRARGTLAAAAAGPVRLSEEQAQAWLLALGDLRLVLGTRLDVDDNVQEQLNNLAEDDPRFGMLVLYDWLTLLQGLLVECLD